MNSGTTTNANVPPLGKAENDIIVPHRNDIICARGEAQRNHEGNKRYRAIIDMHRKQYHAATSKKGRTQICSDILCILGACNPPGRFIRFDLDAQKWLIIGETSAREKICVSLRKKRFIERRQDNSPARKRQRREKSKKSESTPRLIISSEMESLLILQQKILSCLLLEEEKSIFQLWWLDDEDQEQEPTTSDVA